MFGIIILSFLNKKLYYFCISVIDFILSQQGIIILNTMKLIPVGLLLLFKTEAGLTTCVMKKRVLWS